MHDQEYNQVLSKEIPLVQDLAQRFNELDSLLHEHVAYYDEILPHVFMGDVTRYVLSGGSQRQEIVRHLNGAFVNGATEVRDLIAVSFVENIDSEEELELALQDVTAEALRAEWHVQHG
ncbi:MAG: hypothetical protein WCJ40_20430 [Planctomycetota bacterium]